jgi:hypothetical protein
MWVPDTRVVVRPTVLPVDFVAKRQVCAADRIGFALKKNINNSCKDSGATQDETNQALGCLGCPSKLKRSGVVIGTAERMSKAEPFIS